uniref:C2 domain-containing protein n=1 Tax=Palpitomonas bilix TaxID=652834 RepID=A0A7S3DGN3_9EUKA|mmetsp:Transcript_36345/g.94510  ORF Transcript_36345/g.94510 Transcript_36345/m.94510 type:complete len:827 (+) Transcript_36345:110-2590(+)
MSTFDGQLSLEKLQHQLREGVANETEFRADDIATFVSSGLSMAGAVLICISYFTLPSIRTFGLKVLLMLTISDFFAALSHFFFSPPSPNSMNMSSTAACQVQAVFQQYFFVATFLWTAVYAANQYMFVVRNHTSTGHYFAYYSGFCWGIPLLFVIIAGSDDAFGESGTSWCWIKEGYGGFRLGLFYLPLVVSVVVAAVCVIGVVITTLRLPQPSKNGGQESGKVRESILLSIELSGLFVAFVIIRLPSIIHRIEDFSSQATPAWVEFAHSLLSPAQGFFNALILFTSRHTRARFVRAITHARSGRYKQGEGDGLLSGVDGTGEEQDEERGARSIGSPMASLTRDIYDGEVRVFTGTWNVGNAVPPRDLSAWVEPGYDIYALGVQECNYKVSKHEKTPGINVFTPGRDCEQHWFNIVKDHIGNGYTAVAARSLWYIRIIVLVKNELVPYITNVDSATEATGFFHVLGNKGAVGVSLSLKGTSFCFLSCHLAAHQAKVKERNSNSADILNGIRLGERDIEVTQEFRHVFWFGDFNYRVDLPRETVIEAVRERNFELPKANDQMWREIRAGRALYGFEEGEILFPPTYRYERKKKHPLVITPGNRSPSWEEVTGEEERQYSQKKLRIPSYCDRILFTSMEHAAKARECMILAYDAASPHTFITSDHCPVHATFAVKLLRSPPRALRGKKYRITVSELSCKRLRPVAQILEKNKKGLNTADPYITFRSVYMSGPKCTSVAKDTLNPKWMREEEQVELECTFKGDDDLNISHIQVLVKDRTMIGDVDLMGQGAIPLAGSLREEGTTFSSVLVLRGKPAGRIEGLLQAIEIP